MGILNEHITPTGYRLGGTPVNENPFWGDGGGNTKNITATASVDNTTGTPAVEVTKTETTEAVNFDFAFTHLKGEKGDDGDTPEVSATAVVTDVGSTPSVSVVNTGTTEAPNFQFTFDHIGGSGGGGTEDPAACKVIDLGKDQGYQSTLGQMIPAAIKACFARVASTSAEFSEYIGSINARLVARNGAGMSPIYISMLPTVSTINLHSDVFVDVNGSIRAGVNDSDLEPYAASNGVLSDFSLNDVIMELTITKAQAGTDFGVVVTFYNQDGRSSFFDTPFSISGTISGTGSAHFMPGTPPMYSFEADPSLGITIVNGGCDFTFNYLDTNVGTPTTILGYERTVIMFSDVSESSGSVRWMDAIGFLDRFLGYDPILTISIN